MKLLYISHLSTNISAGMNWSVPASVRAQEQIDEVLWINTTDVLMPHWKETNAYRNLKELGDDLCLSVLPKPFDRPDVVLFEGVYFMEYISLSKELRRKHIPYVIIPRASMTYQAMHNHAWLKKWLAHKIWFNSFIRHAWKIQYLTQQEASDSLNCFKNDFFIVPNGVLMPREMKQFFCTDGVKAVFVGRLDMYHKGLDLLFDAIKRLEVLLREEKFTLFLYGPQKYDYEKIMQQIRQQSIEDIIFLKGEVTGEEKAEALLDADLFIMTSRFEGHPMGLIEAMAYGLPCLVTPGSNMANEIKKVDAGWTCEGNVESIKETLIKAIKDKDTYKSKSQHARELAKKYNWDKLAEDFHKYLGELKVNC